MAYIVLTSEQTSLCKVVFKNMTIGTAKTIAAHMNALAKVGNEKHAVKLTYKVVGK